MFAYCPYLQTLAGDGLCHEGLPWLTTGGRNAPEVMPLLTHILKHIADPRHSGLYIGIANRLLDLYAPAVNLLLEWKDLLVASSTILAGLH